jgi:hypothetical protein
VLLEDLDAVGVLGVLEVEPVLDVEGVFGVVDAPDVVEVPGVVEAVDDWPGCGAAADNVTVSAFPTFTSVCPMPETVVAIESVLFVDETGLAEPYCVPMTLNRSVARLLRSVPAMVSKWFVAS